jgi:hypothetical protein
MSSRSRWHRPRPLRKPSIQPILEDLENRLVLSSILLPIFAHGHHEPGVVPTGHTVPLDFGSPTPVGYIPAQLDTAYDINKILFGSIEGDGAGQTIAIVDAYDDPAFVDSTINGQTNPAFSTSDLAEFDQTLGLPDPPSFTKYNELGQTTNLPGLDPAGAGNASGNWEMEEALDIEWAHAIAPAASIDLVEANTDTNNNDLFTAVATAAALPGVSVVSMSWGIDEYQGEQAIDSTFTTPSGHQGVTFIAAAGDQGSPGYYPAYSPNVVAAGGTTLLLKADNSTQSENAWSGSGGGTSAYEPEPAYQEGVQSTGMRTIPDVAWDADPNTGVAVYDSYDDTDGSGPWLDIGGTSVASPSWAGLIAIANQGRVIEGASSLDGPTQTLPALYAAPSADFNDITSGSNGAFSAGPGYDEVTGLGSPKANLLIPTLVAYGAASKIVVSAQPPTSVIAGASFGVVVSAENVQGYVDPAFDGTMTIKLNAANGASLGGTLTVTATQGEAIFDGLTIDQLGDGYSFTITSPKFGSITTQSFDIITNPTPDAGTFYPVPTDASLRGDIEAADSNGYASNTIVLSTATYVLTDRTAGQVVIQNSSSLSAKTLTIAGQGETSSIIEPGTDPWDDRIFEVIGTSPTNMTVVFQGLTIEGGNATGGGTLGGNAALGGGLLIDGGTVSMTRVAVAKDQAVGGAGGDGASAAKSHAAGGGGTGKTGLGGGIYLAAGTLSLNHDTFSEDFAIGGTGGAGGGNKEAASGAAGAGGAGYSAAGGGVYVAGGKLLGAQDTFSGDGAIGGKGGKGGAGGLGSKGSAGGAGGDGGVGGSAAGGAIYLAQGSITLAGSLIQGNTATGGAGGLGGNGGAGSALVASSVGLTGLTPSGLGGSGSPSKSILSSILNGGSSLSGLLHGGPGGAGGLGGAGGSGIGGGVYVGGGSLSLASTTVSGDQAVGGQGGTGGLGGHAAMGSLGGIGSIFGTGSGGGGGSIPLGGSGGLGGAGGTGSGAGLYLAAGTVTLNADTFSGNTATGGAGGTGGTGGDGGFAGGLSGIGTGGGGSGSGGSQARRGHGGNPLLSGGGGTTSLGGGSKGLGVASGGPGGDGGTGGLGKGGALYVTGGTITLFNNTVAMNTAKGGDGGLAGAGGGGGSNGLGKGAAGAAGQAGDSDGGGLYVDGGAVDLFNSTVALNTPSGVVQVKGTVTATSTLFAGNGAVDYSGNVDATNSLFQTAPINGILTGSNNLTGENPLLATAGLANNGGPTETIALQTGSPAIGAGANPENLFTDQRGYAPRTGPGGTDIGAYQHAATADTKPPTATSSAPGVTSSNASTLNPYTFTITYQDNTAVAASSLAGVVVDVSPPGAGAPITAIATSTKAVGPTDPFGNAQEFVVTYQITPPGGSWTTADNGTYTLNLVGTPVTDLSGNTVAAGTLGTFLVNLNGTSSTQTSATLIGVNSTTRGNWIGVYGSQGYNVIGDAASYPSYATVTPIGQSSYTWAASTTDPRALQNPGGTGRIAATWYATSSFTVDVNFTDGQAHDIALYAVDFDENGRSEQIQIINASTGAVLSTETISSFVEGVYLDYTVSGNVAIKVTRLAGTNAVLSGLFFDPPTSPATTTTVSFLGSNATTKGNWIGVYGTQGYNVIDSKPSYPSYATVTPSGPLTYTWAASTTDPRALQNPGGTGRTAAAWYSSSSFTIDVNLTDGQAHDITLYAVDWDEDYRSEQIQIINTVTGTVLDTETISSFRGGVYLEWAVSGNVTIKVTRLAGPNAVLSGLFFDPATTTPTAVKAATPSQLFVTAQPPTPIGAGSAFGLTVAAVNSSGQLDTAYNGTVTASLGSNPAGGTLLGTLTVQFSQGVATFSDLILDQPGDGYTIQLTIAGLPPVTSAPIDVTSPVENLAIAALAPAPGVSALTSGAQAGGSSKTGSSGANSITTTGTESGTTTTNPETTTSRMSRSKKVHRPNSEGHTSLTRTLHPTQLLDHKTKSAIPQTRLDIRNHPLVRRDLART